MALQPTKQNSAPIIMTIPELQKQIEIKNANLTKLKTFIVCLDLYLGKNSDEKVDTKKSMKKEFERDEFEAHWNRYQ